MKMFLALVMAGMAAQGQTGALQSVVAQLQVNRAGSCPVGISAERQPAGQIRYATEADGKQLPGADGASVFVVLVGPAGKVIQRAELEVLYRLPVRALEPAKAEAAGGEKTLATKRFTLENKAGATRLERRLSLGVAGTVKRVRLLSADYVGSSALEPEACSVSPNGLMLVAAR